MAQQRTLLIAKEFFRQYSHRCGQCELVQGGVIEMTAVNDEHGEVASNIDTTFNVYSRHCGVGRARVETGHCFRRNPNRVRGPDVFYWINAPRRRDTRTQSFVFGVPNIAAEVVSHSDNATNPQPNTTVALLNPAVTAVASSGIAVPVPDGAVSTETITEQAQWDDSPSIPSG